ncbi:MAG: O-acetylhomoserine aminocarboxypropyltransferase/cysteine synthase family protein [Rikenellaceae bacterium]
MKIKSSNFETLGVHAGHQPDPNTGSCSPTIHQSTAFAFENSAQGAARFALEEGGMIYTRLGNPTTSVFEDRMAALEGGVAAVATASGMSAQFTALTTICSAGDNIVTTSYLYGGTFNAFRHLMPRFGIEARFADGDNPESIESLIDDKTKAIFIETIGNPEFSIPDFEAIAEIAQRKGVVLFCDNTFGCGGYLCQPLNYGVNVVTHSATKWIGGHATSMGGVIVDGGNFKWDESDKFPLIAQSVESYHGVNFYERFGAAAFAVKVRCEGLRDIGACISPFNSFLLAQGLETLSLRVQRSCDNALALAEWLEQHPKVESVSYPGLESNKYHQLANKYLRNGYGAVLSFRVKGGVKEVTRVVDSLQMIYHLANVGDNKTLIIHPASTTHSQLSEAELESAGVYPNLLRISLGIEHIEDIKQDLDQALQNL